MTWILDESNLVLKCLDEKIYSSFLIIIILILIAKRSSLPENVRAGNKLLQQDPSKLESFLLHLSSSLPSLELSELFPEEIVFLILLNDVKMQNSCHLMTTSQMKITVSPRASFSKLSTKMEEPQQIHFELNCIKYVNLYIFQSGLTPTLCAKDCGPCKHTRNCTHTCALMGMLVFIPAQAAFFRVSTERRMPKGLKHPLPNFCPKSTWSKY